METDHESMATSKPLHISFNQDTSRFSVSTASGFQIYTCDPFREFYTNPVNEDDHSSVSGGIGHVAMLFNSAYLALIGGGPQPQYPVNKAMIWNAHAGRCIGEIVFRSAVKSVKLGRDVIVVALMKKVYVYNFSDLKVRDKIVTGDNPNGLCAVSQQSGVDAILACPGVKQGQVTIKNFGKRNPEFVSAHESRIACLALSQDGKLLATASSKGTLIRVFNSSDRSCLREVRRGADRAEIYSLAFSSTAEWLASSSDKGTVHAFNLKDEPQYNASQPKSTMISSLSFIKGVVPRYFRSEWSFAQFRLPEEGLQQHIVGFGQQKNTIIIVAMDGSFYRCQFDPVRGGEMTQLESSNFLKPQES